MRQLDLWCQRPALQIGFHVEKAAAPGTAINLLYTLAAGLHLAGPASIQPACVSSISGARGQPFAGPYSHTATLAESLTLAQSLSLAQSFTVAESLALAESLAVSQALA